MNNPIRLLYVEDEADIREFAEFILEEEGFELLMCASGQEALDKAAAFKPDIILLDVMMPHMDGPSTLKALRKLPDTQHTPVVFLTAKVQPQEVASFLAMGCVDVIAKPFDPMQLPGRINDILERCHG